MQPGDFHQAVQQRIIVGGAGVGAPFTGGLSDNLSIFVIQQVQMLRETRAMLLALRQFCCACTGKSVRRKVPLAIKASIRFQNADEVRVQL